MDNITDGGIKHGHDYNYHDGRFGQSIPQGRLRMKIYRLYGAEIPADCEIKPRCYLGLGKGHLKMGGGYIC